MKRLVLGLWGEMYVCVCGEQGYNCTTESWKREFVACVERYPSSWVHVHTHKTQQHDEQLRTVTDSSISENLIKCVNLLTENFGVQSWAFLFLCQKYFYRKIIKGWLIKPDYKYLQHTLLWTYFCSFFSYFSLCEPNLTWLSLGLLLTLCIV